MQKYWKHEKLKQHVYPKLTSLTVIASNVRKLSEVLGKEFKRMILSVFRKKQTEYKKPVESQENIQRQQK